MSHPSNHSQLATHATLRNAFLPLVGAACVVACGGRTDPYLPEGAVKGGAGGGEPVVAGSAGLATGGTGGRPEPSAPPLCLPELDGVEAVDLWASESREYLFVASRTEGRTLFVKTPEGWKEEHTGPYVERLHHIAGLGQEVVFEYGGGSCSILRFVGDGSDCSGAVADATKVTMTEANEAYAAYGRYVLKFDGLDWRELAWIDHALPIIDFSVFARKMVLTNGTRLSELNLETGRLSRQVDFEHTVVTAVVLPGTDQLLAGTDSGAVLGDPFGTVEQLGSDSCEVRIQELATSNGTTFARTASEVLRVDGANVVAIHSEGCASETRVAALFARASDALWATIGPRQGDCGPVTVYRSDGQEAQRW